MDEVESTEMAATPSETASVEIRGETTRVDVRNAAVGNVQGDEVEVFNSVVGTVTAGANATLSSGGAMVVAASNDLKVMGGGAAIIAAGRDMTIQGGGGTLIATGRDLRVQGGGGALLFAGNSATLERSYVNVLVSGNVEVGEGGRVLLSTPQALALGAALGAVFALVSSLLRRRRR
jgi:hypothetical protein